MDFGVIGRGRIVADVESALSEAHEGLTTVELEGPPGSGRRRLLDAIEEKARASGFEVSRAVGSVTARSSAGGVAEQLGLESLPSAPALLIEEAQWVDPTSFGLLQRAMASPPTGGLFIAVTHEPVSGHDALPLHGLTDTARRRGRLLDHVLEPLVAADLSDLLSAEAAEHVIALTGGLFVDVERLLTEWVNEGVVQRSNGSLEVIGEIPDTWEGGGHLMEQVDRLERTERKIVDAVYVAGHPLDPALLAEVVDVSSDDVVEIGERLAGAGLISQVRDGFVPVDALAVERVTGSLGEVRHTATLAGLAEAMQQLGRDETDPATIGRYYAEAGLWDQALPFLSRAALHIVSQGELGESFPLLDAAIEAYEESDGDDPELEGRLRLARAQYYSLAGWSDLAADDLDIAIRRLTGPERIDARAFLAAVEDNRQNAQAAETLVAAAAYEAVDQGESAKLGSLLVFHARELTRLGFQNEADAAVEKGSAILDEEGNPFQRFLRRYNTARMAFDRGRAREAEIGFAGLVADADEIEGTGSLADKQAWWARALFQVGRPKEALETIEAAIDNADHAGTSGPIFLSHMARSEGAYRYGQYEEALEAADDMLGFVLQQLPAWENAARYLRGHALLRLGRLDEASAEAIRALELCPEGINGWRWRLKIRALQLQITAEEAGEWPQEEAEDLTDELLQGGWLDTAAELMATRASTESDQELARQAAGLALEIGIPMAAAEAIQSQGLWGEPGSAAVVAGVKSTAHHMPPAWEESWSARPDVAAALAVPDVTDEAVEEAEAELVREIEAALVAAGLADAATTLSPAQRRELGLIRRRPVRRVLRSALVAVGVVILGAASAFAVLSVTGVLDEPAEVTLPTTPTTIPPPSAVQCPPADQITLGSQSGISSADCVHWTLQVGGAIHSSPALHGIAVMFGSRDFSAYSSETETGQPIWQLGTSGEVDFRPTVAEVSIPGASPETFVFVASADGCVYRRAVLGAGGLAPCMLPTGERVIGSAAVAEGIVVFSSADGHVYATDATEPGVEIWRYPSDGELDVQSPPAVFDGTVFVGVEGSLHAIDLLTGSGGVCHLIGAAVRATPVVADGIVYVGSEDTNVWAVEASNCSLAPQPNYLIGTPVVFSPAVDANNIYVSSQNRIVALTLANEFAWDAPFEADGPIFSSPSSVAGTVYFGSDDGHAYALDAATGELNWKFRTNGLVRSTPAPADGAVYVGSTGNTFYAIGEE